MKNNFVVNLYLWKIWCKLRYPKKTKEEILQKYRRYIYETMEEDGPIRSNEELYRRFEKPEIMVEQYMTLITAEEKYKYNQEKLRRVILFSVTVSFLVLFIFVYFLIALKQNQSYSIEIGDKQAIASTSRNPPTAKNNINIMWTWHT